MPKEVGVPTVSGMKDSFKDFGIGCAGGAVAGICMSIFGGLGFLAAPIIAGSMLKGNRGTVVSVMFGTLLGIALLGGGGGGAATTQQTTM